MKKRLLGAILIAIVTVPLLIYGKLPFKLFIMIIASLGTYEIIKAREKTRSTPSIMKIISHIFVLFAIYFGNDYYTSNYFLDYKIFAIAFLVFLLPIVLFNDQNKYNINDALYLLGSTIFLSLGFNIFIIVRNSGLAHIIYLALITIMTDMFAYFGGSLIGKNKLCTEISPNKTIEGSIVGSLVGTIIPILFYIFVINSNANLLILIPITLLLSIIGQCGDLLFSSIKRTFKIKDYSNLIPGHGGILDRLDSLLFVMITYMLCFTIL